VSIEHRILLEPRGRALVGWADRSILTAALAAGLNLPHSCKSGHCGSCRARLLAGEIAYPGALPLGITAAEAAQGFVLTCQARPRSDLKLEALPVVSSEEQEVKRLPCRIESLRPLAPDVLQLFLRLPAVEPLRFAPGQYLDILTGGSRHSFSIASPPHDSSPLELHVRRSPHGRFTPGLFALTGPGQLLRIEGPLGQLAYRDGPQPALFIAGGTGFAPLKSMLRHALEQGSTRELHLYWGARTPVDLYEEALVLEWVRRYPNLRYRGVLSAAAATLRPEQSLGWVHEAVLGDFPRLEGLEVYAAGPPALIAAIRESYPARGLAAGALHFDSFDYPA